MPLVGGFSRGSPPPPPAFWRCSILDSLHPHRLPNLFARSLERLACWPSTPAGSLPDFRMWELWRTMSLVGGFTRGSPVSPAYTLGRCSILTSIALIGSQDFASVYLTCIVRLRAAERREGGWLVYSHEPVEGSGAGVLVGAVVDVDVEVVTSHVVHRLEHAPHEDVFLPARFQLRQHLLRHLAHCNSTRASCAVAKLHHTTLQAVHGWFRKCWGRSGVKARLLAYYLGANWVRYPAGPPPDFRTLPAGFLRDLPFLLTLHSSVFPYSHRFTLIGSQDLDIMLKMSKDQRVEENFRPTTPSGTIPTCENPVTQPGIEPGSLWWEAITPPTVHGGDQSESITITNTRGGVRSVDGATRAREDTVGDSKADGKASRPGGGGSSLSSSMLGHGDWLRAVSGIMYRVRMRMRTWDDVAEDEAPILLAEVGLVALLQVHHEVVLEDVERADCVPRASHNQSESEYGNINSTATPFRLCASTRCIVTPPASDKWPARDITYALAYLVQPASSQTLRCSRFPGRLGIIGYSRGSWPGVVRLSAAAGERPLLYFIHTIPPKRSSVHSQRTTVDMLCYSLWHQRLAAARLFQAFLVFPGAWHPVLLIKIRTTHFPEENPLMV
ncbi:hypothetical protein PR048_001829 [Dryococelus australis]|uniref:Uncharacterized protein n=1 Tax=Dryococelus australis TaxID=614101 RepID=A0ABQ9IJX2_9NEOP|nr:hypothetical protein PR048_001829 [Dryococelus australis]